MGDRLRSLLAEGPRLIVSLPRNSPELARAAAEGGADALKVHLNVSHGASGTQFGSLAEERGSLEEILAVGLPTGLVPGGAEHLPSPQEMRELAEMGIDFVDLFARDMPVWVASLEGMTRVAAIGGEADPEAVAELERLGVNMIEAAIVPAQGYGRPLSVADLAAYRRLRRATKLPIIVPTERAIRPEEVSLLVREIGINAVMIGAVVTGREAGSLRAVTGEFAAALAEARD